MQLSNITFLKVPVVPEERGNLSFLQNSDHIPFDIKRVYWINNIPGAAMGKGHANKESNEIIIALSGSFDVVVHDGIEEKKYTLNRPDFCLSIPCKIWRSLENFSTNSVAFVAEDRHCDDNERILDFSVFKTSYINA